MSKFKFFIDTHIPLPAIEQLRRKGVDILRSIEAGFAQDEEDVILLEYATRERRIVITCDFDFEQLAHEWQGQDKDHASILYLNMAKGACADVGLIVEWVDLIAATASEGERLNRVWRAK